MMLRKSLVIILILVSVNAVNAWMIEGDVSPHKGDRNTEITINYSLNEVVGAGARVKIYLNAYDPVDNGFDYTIDQEIIDYFDVNPGNVSPIKIKLTSTASGFYRVCLKLAYDGSYYQDCDSQNQFLLIDDTPIINQGVEQSEIIKLIVESPQEVFAGDYFQTNITIVNEGSADFEGRIYSYVINGSSKVSEGSWTANEENLLLSPGSEASLTLSNLVPIAGKYNLTIKAGQKLFKQGLRVINKPEGRAFLSDLVAVNDLIRISVSNTYPDAKELFIKLYSENYSYNNTFNLSSRRSYEDFINKSLFSGVYYVFLYDNGFLLDEKQGFNNGTLHGPIRNSSLDNGSPVITGYFNLGINMETLLYPVIVVFSVLMLGVLLWKT